MLVDLYKDCTSLVDRIDRCKIRKDEIKNEIAFLQIEENYLKEVNSLLGGISDGISDEIESKKQILAHAEKFSGWCQESCVPFIALPMFLEKLSPTCSMQIEKMRDLESNYKKCVEKYEQKVIYEKIVSEEIGIQELKKTIQEKKNEMMKLETSKEF